ncbi:hypothetical protein Agub_g5200 [Astrephomene gubernaculifera]|uniref:Flavodoxin-like domain-containing protein n=1 Tax=Astrephomene gubernaculifera TaxID=47775 RepID=A0AAD3DLH1_9CHLO|nr:hypothetical protein Agub_g5200 [Astrephomene gubernaculifera]
MRAAAGRLRHGVATKSENAIHGLPRARHTFALGSSRSKAGACKAYRRCLQRRCKATLLVQATASPMVTSDLGPAPTPPPTEPVEVEYDTFQVAPNVQLLRGSCRAERLKYEVEYGLKRGTTDNSYLITSPGAVVLVDVPYEAYKEKFVEALSAQAPLPSLTHLLITHLDPKAIPTLELLLLTRRNQQRQQRQQLQQQEGGQQEGQAVAPGAAAAAGSPGSSSGSGGQGEAPPLPPLQVVLSNPALKLLESTLGSPPPGSPSLLSGVQLQVAGRSGAAVAPCGPEPGDQLQVFLAPTPRWPDLLLSYDPANRILLSSKLFSAHVAPRDKPYDEGGWEALEEDWRYYFDCMLAPSAKQAAAALDKLDLVPVARQSAAQEGELAAAGGGGGGRPRRVNKTSAALRSFFRSLLGLPAPKLSPPAPPTDPASEEQSSSTTASTATATSSLPQLPVCQLLPLHGPLVSSSLAVLLLSYRNWIQQQLQAAASGGTAAVLYASAYGNTAALAQAISRGISLGGVAVEAVNLETASLEEVAAAVGRSQGFVLGSPTLGGHMPTLVSLAMGAILRDPGARGLPCGVFGSFGWSGEAVDEMAGRLRDAGFGFAFEAIRVKFKPTAKDLLLCEESGRALAAAIRKRARSREMAVAPGSRALTASGPQLAMGRLVGSLAVVTARDEDATAAMLASWLAQASFDPPGITIAVKRDRPLGQLLGGGARFVVSLVSEGRQREVMRRLSGPFAPGADRLAGLDTFPSPSVGAPVLAGAASWLECEVAGRLEAGDHTVLYAQVLDGRVVDEAASTAVHHRKVGNHY